jgi:hypothetical protein
MNDPTTGPGKKPLAVYAIIERKEKNHWLKVGAAFANRDGSVTVYLDAVPVGSNRLQIREQRAWDDARAPGGNGAATHELEAHP